MNTHWIRMIIHAWEDKRRRLFRWVFLKSAGSMFLSLTSCSQLTERLLACTQCVWCCCSCRPVVSSSEHISGDRAATEKQLCLLNLPLQPVQALSAELTVIPHIPAASVQPFVRLNITVKGNSYRKSALILYKEMIKDASWVPGWMCQSVSPFSTLVQSLKVYYVYS